MLKDPCSYGFRSCIILYLRGYLCWRKSKFQVLLCKLGPLGHTLTTSYLYDRMWHEQIAWLGHGKDWRYSYASLLLYPKQCAIFLHSCCILNPSQILPHRISWNPVTWAHIFLNWGTSTDFLLLHWLHIFTKLWEFNYLLAKFGWNIWRQPLEGGKAGRKWKVLVTLPDIKSALKRKNAKKTKNSN